LHSTKAERKGRRELDMRNDDGMAILVVLFIIVIVVLFKGGIGYLIGKRKGKGALGFMLGLFLGIIGWIIIAVIPGETPSALYTPSARRRCRQCRRAIPRGSIRCPQCQPGGDAPAKPAKDGRVPCPLCAELIMPGARVCRFCHNKI